MKDRMLMQEMWERMEVPDKDVLKVVAQAPERDDFQILLFSKIVPNLKKLGLLDAADGWLRQKFTEMGAIAFEHLADSTEEVDAFADGSPADAPGGLGGSRANGPGSAPQEGSARATDSVGGRWPAATDLPVSAPWSRPW